MFDDFGEREHVFNLLEDEWASPELPNDFSLENLVSGTKAEFRKRVRALSEALAQVEAKNTRPPRALIRSFQSELLSELDFLLFMCDRPAVLRGHLNQLKMLLMDAWIIHLELKAGTLKIMAAKGESFTGQGRGRSGLYALVEALLRRHGVETSAKSMWSILKNECGGSVIDEIVDDEGGLIYLRNKEKPVSFRAFEKQLSEIRKILRR